MTDPKKTNLRLVDDFEIPEDVIDHGPDVFEPDEQFWYGFNEFAEIDRVREYIVKGWLIAHGVTALLAKRGTGKSTLALDLACHLATDRDWWGIPAMKDWCIIYICGEDDEGMILNCRAWAQKHGEKPSDDRFRIAKGIISLTDKPELERRRAEMVDWARGRRCIVILDTWARATSGYSASTQEEMDVAYENAEEVARAVNGPMIACFHPPKGSKELTIRGSAVQEDASSGIWEVKKVPGGIELKIGRAKGKGEGSYRTFRTEVIELPGVDFYGDPLEGIVPIKTGGSEDSTINWVEKQRADATTFKREQTAYANMVLDVMLTDTDKDWTVADMADAIKGMPVSADGHMVVAQGKSKTREKLPDIFAHPITPPPADGSSHADRGYIVSLGATGETGPGGRPVHHFKIEEITPDTGKSGE